MDYQVKVLLEKMIDYTMDQDAEGCEFMVSSGSSLSLKAQQALISEYKVASSLMAGVRLKHNGKIGIGYCEEMSEKGFKTMIEQALTFSKYAEESPHEIIGAGGPKTDVAHVNIKNYFPEEVPTQDKKDLCLSLESKIKEQEPSAKCPYNGVSEGTSEFYLFNHLGVKCYSKANSTSCYTSALLEEQKLKGMWYKSHRARSFYDLDPNRCVEESLLLARDFLQGKPIPTGKYDVIFTPETLSQFLGKFSLMFSGKAAMEGRNPMLDKLKTQVADSRLTLRDIPNHPEAFSEYLFDSEGLLHKELTLIERGVFKNLYHNSSTARYFDVKNTAHASRSIKGMLGTGSLIWSIDGGQTPAQDLRQGSYLEVHQMDGFGPNSDPISGDFSFGCLGYLVKNGEKQPVKEITVSGNFYRVLNQIEDLSREVFWDESFEFLAPTIRFGSLQVAG
jgi:PmbA protein